MTDGDPVSTTWVAIQEVATAAVATAEEPKIRSVVPLLHQATTSHRRRKVCVELTKAVARGPTVLTAAKSHQET